MEMCEILGHVGIYGDVWYMCDIWGYRLIYVETRCVYIYIYVGIWGYGDMGDKGYDVDIWDI